MTDVDEYIQQNLRYYLAGTQEPTKEEIATKQLERVELWLDDQLHRTWWVRDGLGSHYVYNLQAYFEDLAWEGVGDDDDEPEPQPNWAAFAFRYDRLEHGVGYSHMVGDRIDTKMRSMVSEPLD